MHSLAIKMICKRSISISCQSFMPLDKKRLGRIPLDRRERATAKSGSPHRPGGSYDWLLKLRYHYNVQSPGYVDQKRKRFIYVKEMEPQIVAPEITENDLNRLKPYVSYNVDIDGIETGTVQNEATTPREIFNHVHAQSVHNKLKDNTKKRTDIK